ncbi:MAG: PIN domain-containing protein [Lachnospiraceae bacterium]|nr:PIN domain-containing protein [Lachnospiraceae bacterium]
MKILLDTNVIIDALTSREPWNKSAEKIFLMGANHIVDMYITASSATDIYYLLRKFVKDTAGSKQIMSKLYSLIGILDVTAANCVEALASPISDYEDAVVEKVAASKEMDYIVTRNIKDYKEGTVKVILPDDFISMLEEEV